MSFYMFLHFKSDNVPHLTPLYPPLVHSSPVLCLLFNFQLTFINSHLSFVHCVSLSPVLYSMVFGLFPFPLCFPCHLHDIFHFYNALFWFSISPFFLLLLLSAPTPLLLLQSLCVRGRCCGCRRPVLCRRQSTRRGHGVRTRCSLGTVCMLCPGLPIAPTCCMSMPPGKTSNRTEPPPPTSEGASHCPGWSNSICSCIDLLAFHVDIDGDSSMVPLWCQLAHYEAVL